MWRNVGFGGAVTALLFVTIVAGDSSCAQTPPNLAIRSFEGAQKAASVCLQVNDPQGYPLASPPAPQTLDSCISVPSGVNGALFANHLYVLVTQTVRGEVAVVDLSAGDVVDEDRSTPGTNFIPVGTNPTDVVVAPDARFSYVSSASAQAPAIYALDNSKILGTSVNWQSTGANGVVTHAAPLQLPDLTACRLSDAPLALGVVPVPDASGDAGASTTYDVVAMLGGLSGPASIVLIDPVRSGLIGGTPGALPACVIAGSVQLSSQLPATWVPGPAWPDGVVYADAGSLADAEPGPGPACIMTPTTLPPPDAGAVTVVGAPVEAGVTVEAGASPEAGTPVEASAPLEAGTPVDGAAKGLDDAELDDEAGAQTGAPSTPHNDAEADAEPESAQEDAEADGGSSASSSALFPLVIQPLSAPNPRFMAMRTDVPILYVADNGIPVIHVIDLSNPASPQEMPPLLATSLTEPARQVQVGGLAISPSTRDYKIYLYAIDTGNGSLMVYDVSDPASPTRMPMTRPHAELNPFLAADRISFSAPVATVAFVQHDWPIPAVAVSGIVGNMDDVHTFTGFQCNPGFNAHPSANVFNDLGAWYRVDQVSQIEPQATVESFPSRLRGVFAFATLTNGNIVAVDVDDWDAPCRRPDPMATEAQSAAASYPAHGWQTGALDLPEPAAASATDYDPHHVPIAYNPAIAESPSVTLEPFYPVSAPHRVRSASLLRNDPTSGNHAPNLLATPLLVDVNGNPVPSTTTTGLSPTLLPTTLPAGYWDFTPSENPVEPDPTNMSFTPVTGTLGNAGSQPVPGVRFSFEDPTAMQNDDWTVTYEGTLPATTGTEANFASTPNLPVPYTTLTLTVSAQNLCTFGIEDSSIGQARANQVLAALAAANLPLPSDLPQWTGDYVQITDDVAPQYDPYWYTAPPGTGSTFIDDAGEPTDNCWVGTPYDEPSATYYNDRYEACYQTFGPSGDLNSYYARDLPILAAYSDHLVVGRFGWPNGVTEGTNNRTVVANDPVNSRLPLRMATCCFHRQAAFQVRTGGEWVANGSGGVGFLHHVVTNPATGQCTLSCNPNDVLLNARSFDIPYAVVGAGTKTGGCVPPGFPFPAGQVSPAVDRNSILAMRNPMFSYVTWSGCSNTPLDVAQGQHTFTARDLSWHFSVRGGFSPLTISLTGGVNTTVNPQSMLFIDPLGQLAVVDGSLQGLVIFDLNSLAMSHNPFF
jgi:hypothetical protein